MRDIICNRQTKDTNNVSTRVTINNDHSNCNKKIVENDNKRCKLFDKTNYIIDQNKLIKNVNKSKNENDHSPKNMCRKNQKRISDFFCDAEHNNINKTISETDKNKSFKKLNKNKLSVCLSTDNIFTSRSNDSEIQEIHEANYLSTAINDDTENKSHTRVYKQLPTNEGDGFNGRKSNIKDKSMLYEFEVNENEEPFKKKRKKRFRKSSRIRKRICKENEPSLLPELNYNRPEKQALSETCKIIDNTDKIVCSTGMNNNNLMDKANFSCSDLINPVITNKTPGNDINRSVSEKHSLSIEKSSPLNNLSNGKKLSYRTPNKSSCFNGKDTSKNPEYTRILLNASKNNYLAKKLCIASDKTINDSVNSQVLMSPLHDNEKVISSSFNSSGLNNISNTEYKNSFTTGITASTPIRMMSTIKKNNLQIRLSGGGLLNEFQHHIDDESDDECKEECFGFKVNDNYDDSFNLVKSNGSTLLETNSICNKSVQKISVREVINLLKSDVQKLSNYKTSLSPVSTSDIFHGEGLDKKLNPGIQTDRNNQLCIMKYINKEKDIKNDTVEIESYFSKVSVENIVFSYK